jgi:putative oxidoreductase
MLRVTAIWTMAVIIGLLFVLVGWSKLAGPSGTDWAVRLSRWGYPAASRYGIGGIEILAGLGLFVPLVRRAAAVTLIVVMVGAFVTHLVHGEFVHLLPPLILAGLSYGLYAWQPYTQQKA